jgi:hypothetical protein
MTRSQIAMLGIAFVVSVGLGVSVQSGSAASLNFGTQNLTPYRTCIVTATPSSTTRVADAVVKQGSATTNFGTQTTSQVSSAPASANMRSYLKFDLTGCSPSIPSGATIRAATLRLYASALPTTCRTLDVFRVTSTWAEGTITWNNQPFGTTLNNPATASRTDSFDAGTPAGCQNLATGYVSGADTTTDVAAWVAGTATNFGWMIRDDTESSTPARTVTFSAKDLATLAQAPQLVVTYVTTP